MLSAAAPTCVAYVPGWLRDDGAALEGLIAEIEWEQPTVTVFGRRHPTPRLTAWFGDDPYTYSGITHAPRQWPPVLDGIRRRLIADLGTPFNSCLANWYRTGSDSMGAHSDNESELGPEPVIASVSLGARRRFVLAPVVGGAERFHWDLGEGDLLVMTGESQTAYRHSVPKTGRPVGPRVNLTFRRFLPENRCATGSP